MGRFFEILQFCDNILWSYIALAVILVTGIYITIKSKFLQFRILYNAKKHISDLVKYTKIEKQGVHPLKLYFASVGGMIGLGNIVSVVAVVTIAGPSSIVWMWLASFIGMMVKYSEIYLGVKYRIKVGNRYDGGPMYYLQRAFKSRFLKKFIPTLMCVLLCIYGAEVSQFLILTDVMSQSIGISKVLAVVILLALVLVSSIGGVKRLATICTALIPPFMITYIAIGLFVILANITKLPSVFITIFSDMFSINSTVGGVLLAAHYGVSRAVYSGDIGVGYDSIVQSETRTSNPEKQARLGVFALLSDTLICTISVLILLVTDCWQNNSLLPSEYVAFALSNYLPVSLLNIYMPLLFFVVGFTTIVGYLVVGQKCATFLSPRFGRGIYIVYAICALVMFSFYDQTNVMLLMSVSGGCLMLINVLGLLKLRNEIIY